MATNLEIRAEEEILLGQVRAGVRDAAIIALVKLLDLRVGKKQTAMLTCQVSEFPALQAEALELQKLVTELRAK